MFWIYYIANDLRELWPEGPLKDLEMKLTQLQITKDKTEPVLESQNGRRI